MEFAKLEGEQTSASVWRKGWGGGGRRRKEKQKTVNNFDSRATWSE